METIPAPTGTYIIEREQGATVARRIPVIGFLYVQQGPVYPLCAIAHGGLTRGRALVTADGFVTDPSFGVVCGNVDEWMALSGTSGYWAKPETPRDAVPAAAPVAGTAAPVVVGREPVAFAAKPAAPVLIPDKPKGKPQSFQTTSFWRVATPRALGTPETIFIVEPGVSAPGKADATYEKIKRDHFQVLKREGAEVVLWPLPATAPSSEPEDADDDGSDLI